MVDAISPPTAQALVSSLFGLILCAEPEERAQLAALLALPMPAGAAEQAARLAHALEARMRDVAGARDGEQGMADHALHSLGAAAPHCPTLAEVDAAVLVASPGSAELAIAAALARIRRRIAARGRKVGQTVVWAPLAPPLVASVAPPTLGRAAQTVLAGAGAALDMTGMTKLLQDQMEALRTTMGKVNILIAGRSGVGKSTLINAIFGRAVAQTGIGRPVTQDIGWYEPDDLPVRLCDTRGLEMARFDETFGALAKEVARCARSADGRDHIHILWLCIAEPSARVEEAERRVLELCRSHAIQGVVVLTKAFGMDDMTAEATRELPGAAAVLRVLAQATASQPARGVDDLVRTTLALLTGEARQAFNAAQQVDIEAKRGAALKIAMGAAGTAALAAATPVPLADSAGVLTVNVGMIAGIAVAMGVPLKRENLMPMATSIVGALAVTFGARLLGGSIIKLVPGIGTLAGGAINAALASSATYGLGHGFTEYLCRFFGREHRMPMGEEIAQGFAAFWEKWDRKKEKPPG